MGSQGPNYDNERSGGGCCFRLLIGCSEPSDRPADRHRTSWHRLQVRYTGTVQLPVYFPRCEFFGVPNSNHVQKKNFLRNYELPNFWIRHFILKFKKVL